MKGSRFTNCIQDPEFWDQSRGSGSEMLGLVTAQSVKRKGRGG